MASDSLVGASLASSPYEEVCHKYFCLLADYMKLEQDYDCLALDFNEELKQAFLKDH